jgi:hypothetical protein
MAATFVVLALRSSDRAGTMHDDRGFGHQTPFALLADLGLG